ncbi:ABC exporter ATP-binding subunit [Furfurilactobacillus rossiae]|uniref:ABC transporter ATP-binding protein n=1 Tax=Furfurilactobacillus rossiae TaxID=231049 RepID=UPI0015BCEABE|nr:ABC transporter ATP-binding protein [Furfurilactobacillus rossiae]MCF6166304.1 ABC transporter ATP-binding protein [Furfurilactobacillus rossiae]QLE65130.1 ABC exporter ATP-binding subunit [Furfurilactobacillus rossiae]
MSKGRVEVGSVSKNFSLGGSKTVDILDNISFSAKANEFLSIVGPSGSGKSTLLKCMSGLLKPTSGTIAINSVDPYSLKPSHLAKMRRSEIGFIFQSYNLVPALPVFENISLPLRLSRKSIDKSVVEEMLRKMNFNAELTSFVDTLSGGEQQKVAIARVLVTHPQIIFADEPTGAVDAESKQIIFNILRKLADEGACVIMVTHDVDLAAMTDKALVLKNGQIRQTLTGSSASEILAEIERK